MKVAWRSTTTAGGAQCVTTTGMSLMPLLFAANLITLRPLVHLVRLHLVLEVDPFGMTTWNAVAVKCISLNVPTLLLVHTTAPMTTMQA